MSFAASTNPVSRNRAIDGWRAIAVLSVTLSHVLNYRFSYIHTPEMLWAQKLSGLFAATGVQILFVISGYMISTTLKRELQTNGKVNILRFYARRGFRLIPPALGYFLFISMAVGTGYISMPPSSALNALLFSCNMNFVDCQWFSAHTWSWAVTQQYYIIWPILFCYIAPMLHGRVVIMLTIALMVAELLRTPVYHSNFISFGCVMIGTAYATSQTLQDIVNRYSHPFTLIMACLIILTGALFPLNPLLNSLTPVLILWLLFASVHLDWVQKILTVKPIQIVATMSYSLFLWQQFFLAKPELYAGSPPDITLLPIAVLSSYLLTEMPFTHLSHQMSKAFKTHSVVKGAKLAIIK